MVDTSGTTGFPILSTLLLLLVAFAWVLYIWVAITVITDVFRRNDLSGWGKAAWVFFIVLLSWVGVLIYLITNHSGMNERREKDVKLAQGQFDNYVRSVSGGPKGAATEIATAKQLLDSGTITQAQFDGIKAKALLA